MLFTRPRRNEKDWTSIRIKKDIRLKLMKRKTFAGQSYDNVIRKLLK